MFIKDIETDEEYAPYRDAARAAGYRSVLTTPLRTDQKIPVGTVSTHFVGVHTPTPIEINTLTSYSLTAANYLHKLLGDESLQDKALFMRMDCTVARDRPARREASLTSSPPILQLAAEWLVMASIQERFATGQTKCEAEH